MATEEWFVFGYYVNKSGKSAEVKPDEWESFCQKTTGFTWIHLSASGNETIKWLEETAKLDTFTIEALMAEETRPRIQVVDKDSLLIILRGINLYNLEEPEDMVSIRLFMNKNVVISTRLRKLKATSTLKKKIIKGQGPKTTSQFIATLISLLNEKIEPYLSTVIDQIDEYEEQVLEKPDEDLRESVVNIRKKAVIFKRYMTPQRDVINHLLNVESTWFNKKEKLLLVEAAYATTKGIEDLDAIRERTSLIQEEIKSYQADKLNRNTYTLSIVSSIFLPLTFLTGLFGANVGGVPWASNNLGFSLLAVFLLVVVIVQIAIFKIKKWF
jgi:zinc transporter